MAKASKQFLLVLFGFCIESTGNSTEQHIGAQKAAFRLPWTSEVLQLQAYLVIKRKAIRTRLCMKTTVDKPFGVFS